MTTFLFTWVPAFYEELYGHYEDWQREGTVDVPNWAVARKAIPEGAPLFVMRQGSEPRGIIARGRTTSLTKTPGAEGNDHDNDVRLEEFSHPDNPIIPLEQLLLIRTKPGLWDARRGGIAIPDEVAEQLDRVWVAAWAARGVGKT